MYPLMYPFMYPLMYPGLTVQEQPAFDKKAFTGYIKGYLQKVAGMLSEEEAAAFKANSPAAVKWLMGKLSDLQL